MSTKTRPIPQLTNLPPLPSAVGFNPAADAAMNSVLDDIIPPPSRSASAIAKKNAVTGWKLLILGLLGINALFLVGIIVVLMGVTSKSQPIFITRGNGETENIEFFTGNQRSPALIKFYAEKSISAIYTWRNTLPEKGNPPDPGVVVDGGKKIPTTTFRYTLALEPEFANSFRKQLSELQAITQGSSDTQTAYLVEQVGEPEAVGSGKWKIKVIGNQLIQSKDRSPVKMPINVELTLRAVSPPLLSEVSRKYADVGLAKAAAMARAEGLEILSITNLK
jgi:hypothetical protein